MNSIFIRTDKGEYFPGDNIFGAVYLQVVSPISGEGIEISFSGFEAYLYTTFQPGKEPKISQGKKDYVECRKIKLYTFDGAVPLGQYVFPFKWQLPWNLPGSFLHSGQDSDNRWDVEVTYSVEANLTGAEDIKAGQPFVVHQLDPKLRTVIDLPCTILSCDYPIKQGFFTNGTLKIMSRLSKLLYPYNENAHLDVDIEFVKCKVNILSISVKLLRELILKGEKSRSLDKVGSMRSDASSCPQEEVVPPFVVSRSEFKVMENFSLKRGVKNIVIPLCQRQDDLHTSGYPTSCNGKFIQCKYWIEVVVVGENGHVFNLSLPELYVGQRDNQEWHLATIPSWCSNCKILSSSSNVCSVSKRELASEAFTGLPGFMIL